MALALMEQGKVYHPETGPEYPWLKTLEDELLLWTGADDDVADQVDCLAYAAMEATKCALAGRMASVQASATKCRFVQDHAVVADAAKRVGVVGGTYGNGAAAWQFDATLDFVFIRPG